ncbi:SET domain-containing protein-lysine N-methyltransferase [Thermoproteota archaeon]
MFKIISASSELHEDNISDFFRRMIDFPCKENTLKSSVLVPTFFNLFNNKCWKLGIRLTTSQAAVLYGDGLSQKSKGAVERKVPHFNYSLLHLAVLAGNSTLCKQILEWDPLQYLYEDANGMTPLHLAAVMQYPEIVELFRAVQNQAVIQGFLKDFFGAEPADYLTHRLDDFQKGTYSNVNYQIGMYSPVTDNVESISITDVEILLNITYCPHWLISSNYLHYILFNSPKNRQRHGDKAEKKEIISKSSNIWNRVDALEYESQLALRYIPEINGYGVYYIGKHNLEEGEIICSYGGVLKHSHPTETNDYIFMTQHLGIQFDLDPEEYGNIGRMINHSEYPNADWVESIAYGRPVILIRAIKTIEPGEHVLISYGNDAMHDFFTSKGIEYIEFNGHEAYGSLPAGSF